MGIENLRLRQERSLRRKQIEGALASRHAPDADAQPSEAPLPDQDTNKKSNSLRNWAIVGGVAALGAVVASRVYRDEETGKFDHGKFGKSLAKVVATGAAEGIAGVAGITVRHHRELTHKSLELSEKLQKAIDAEQRSLGVAEPYTWASVHRIHHEMEDTSLFPFYRIHHAMRVAEERGLEVPEKFGEHLDPFVKSFDRETVAEIGAAADEIVQKRLSDPRLGEHQYEEPSFADATDAEILDILNPTEAQYVYPPYERKTSAEEYTQDDIAHLLLTDPHSPALISVQGVAVKGVNLYQSTANMFRAIPLLKPEDLQQPQDELPPEERKISRKEAVVGGFAINAAAMFVANRDFTPKGVVRAVLEGAATNGIRGGMEIVGGNVTNSAGHMGDPVQTEIARAFLNKEYDIKLKPDGTISTNTVGKGVVGRLASWATLDEVGGQEIHHRSPEKIKYTDKEGIQAVIEAPWGSFLEFLAKNERVRAIKEGTGFGDEPRQDVVNPAVQLIQAERAKQYALDHENDENVVFSQ